MKKLGLTLLSLLTMLFILVTGTTSFAANNYEIKHVVVTKDNVNYSLSLELYKAALVEEYVTGKEVTNIISTSGKIYSIKNYRQALVEAEKVSEALKLLDSTNLAKNISITPGGFDSKGEIISKDDEDFYVIGIE